jgi:uncharacterized membrane protein (UPF0182 family)
MHGLSEEKQVTGPSLWAGRVISTLAVLFLIFDGVTKLMRVAPVMQAFARLGYAPSLAPILGTILLACVVVYVIPSTSILGAILLTGYLGGAVDANVHAGNPLFETLFPVIFGILVWAGIFLRDNGLRAMIPLRR